MHLECFLRIEPLTWLSLSQNSKVIAVAAHGRVMGVESTQGAAQNLHLIGGEAEVAIETLL